MARWLKSVLALVVLLGLVVGVPLLLIAVAGWPLPSKLPSFTNAVTMARQGNVPSEVVINTIAVVVWVSWAQLMWAVIWETVVNVPRLVSGRRWRPAPVVLSPIGDGVARLFSVILAVGVLATSTASSSPVLASPSGIDAPFVPSALDIDAARPTVANQRATTAPQWTVGADDDLWSIAQHALGDGARVDDIVALNPGLSARNLRAGMVLELPGDAVVGDAASPAVSPTVDDGASVDVAAPAAPNLVQYVVQDNDGMWNVAEALLGDGSRHTELYDRLAGQEVAPGVVFTADTYVIHPGWVFTLPSGPETPPDPAPPEALADPAVSEHVVEVGESLWSIAESELGDAHRWPEIWEAEAGEVMDDGRTFSDPNLIQPGWRLDIPHGPPVAGPPLEPAEVAPVVPTMVPELVSADVDVAPSDGAPVETSSGDPAASESAPPNDDTAVTADVEALPPPPASVGPVEAAAPAAARVVPESAVASSTTPAAGASPIGSATGPGEADAPNAVGLGSVRDWRPVWMLGLGGSSVLATGLWAVVRRLRRRAGARGGAYLRETSSDSQLVDEALRTSSDTALVTWANVHLGELVRERGVNDRSSLPRVVKLGKTNGLTVHWEPPLPTTPVGGWEVAPDGVEWCLRPPVTPIELTPGPVALPGLVTIGVRGDDGVLIDLESCGSMAVYGEMAAAESLVRSMVLELGAGGLLSNCQVHTVGLDVDGSEQLSRVRERTETEAIEHLRAIRVQHDDVLAQAERSSMFELRAASSPEGREITVIAVRGTACERLSELLESAAPQRGVAVIVVGEAPCATSIVIEGDRTAVVSPLGLVVGVAGVPRQTASAIAVHMDRLGEALLVDAVAIPAAVESSCGDAWSEPSHLIRVLGEPSIDGAPGLGWRELEVLAFAACVGGSVTDDELIDAVFCGRLDRTDVWDLVGGIRADAGTLLAPRNEGGNEISLSAGSLSDVQWMGRLAFRSHARDDVEAVADLVTAMSLVGGKPFSSSAGFEWASTTGDLAGAYEMIERCGYLLVERAIAAGMFDEARGSLVTVLDRLGPNEPLTQALMRLEGAAGDDRAVQSVYGEFSRSLAYLSDGPVAAAPGNATTMLLTRATDRVVVEAPVVAVPVAEPDPVRRTLRPKVLLRTFGEVCVEGSSTTQALAVAFAVAAAKRPMSGDDLAELTGYSRKSLSTVFTSANELLERSAGRLALRDGVWTDHQWMIECGRRARAADEAGDIYDVSEWLRTLFGEIARVDGAAFASQPGKKAYWAWVDDFPVDVSARAVAESELVEAALLGVSVWRSAEAQEHLPAEIVVKAVCKLARLVPFAAVSGGVRPGDTRSAAECLLLAAHGAATGRGELVNTVIATAQRLVADSTIEASDELADALGL